MKAAIDIGTNTTLLLVADTSKDYLEIIHEEQRVPRLGRGVDEGGYLSEEAMNRVIDVIKEYQSIIGSNFPQVDEIYLTATSAVRDAENRSQFIENVKVATGLRINILSGDEEAEYTFWGARSVLDEKYLQKPSTVIDIGGGSTEIALGTENNLRDIYSFDMGCVRFTERYLTEDPPTKQQLNRCRNAIRKILNSRQFNFPDEIELIGVAGTVTSLAYIMKSLDSYNSAELMNFELTLPQITNFIKEIESYSSQKLLNHYPVVMEGRADIFLAGILILEGFMVEYGFDRIITSTGGIRHGAVLKGHG